MTKNQIPIWGIWFVTLITLPTPWLGREALNWIVDMSSTGVSVGYFFTCLAAYKLLAWKAEEQGREIDPVKKALALIGIVCSLIFIGLLLIPVSPAALTGPSYILLVVWGIVGVGFYFVMRKRYNSLTAEETEYYVLGKTIDSEAVVEYDEEAEEHNEPSSSPAFMK